MNELKEVVLKNADGEWYVIPSILSEVFDESLAAADKSEEANDHFIELFNQYWAKDGLDKVQLYAKI